MEAYTGTTSRANRISVFVMDQNIALYRELLDAETDEGRRRTILSMLSGEMARRRAKLIESWRFDRRCDER